MTTTTITRPMATAECYVCGTEFEYPKRPGRPPVKCSAACKRAANNAAKARSKLPHEVHEYPTGLPQVLPTDDLEAMRLSREVFLENERARTARDTGSSPFTDIDAEYSTDAPEGDGELRPATFADTSLAGPEWHGEPSTERAEGDDWVVTVTVPEAVFTAAGHGYVIDDYVDADSSPLRLMSNHPALRAEYARLGQPVVGYYTGSTSNPKVKGRLPVLGRAKREEVDLSNLPPRITRRFCSETAVTPMEPFTLTF